MKDRRGVMRGACRECVGECDQYETPANPDDNKCQYCLCPPTKHEKVIDAAELQVKNSENDAMVLKDNESVDKVLEPHESLVENADNPECHEFIDSAELQVKNSENDAMVLKDNESVDKVLEPHESLVENADNPECHECTSATPSSEISTNGNNFSRFIEHIKGAKNFDLLRGYENVIKYSATGTGASVVRAHDSTFKEKKKWDVGFDKPHGVKVAQSTARSVEVLKKVTLPVAVAVECAVIGKSVYDDVQRGTTRNSVEAVAQSAGGWTGGFGGAALGATIGTAMLPGIGTIVGGIVGSISGGIGGALGVGAAVEKISDTYDFDLEESNCENCSNTFKNRKYKGENRKFCKKCGTYVMKIECEMCSEKFNVQNVEKGNGFCSEFCHTLCPSVTEVEENADKLYDVIDDNCIKCDREYKTRSYELYVTSKHCHSCSFAEYNKVAQADDKKTEILELLLLVCENCGEAIFLRISKPEGSSEFRHKYCPNAKPRTFTELF